MNGVVYLREDKPQLWQASADRLHWTPLIHGTTEEALEQARLTFCRQLVAVMTAPLPSAPII